MILPDALPNSTFLRPMIPLIHCPEKTQPNRETTVYLVYITHMPMKLREILLGLIFMLPTLLMAQHDHGLSPPDKVVPTKKIQIVPNPNTGDFNLQFADVGDAEVKIRVINAIGQLIYAKTYEEGETRSMYHIDMKNAPAGIYLLQAEANEQVYTRKLIISD